MANPVGARVGGGGDRNQKRLPCEVFPIAAVTNRHKLSDIKQHIFVQHGDYT